MSPTGKLVALLVAAPALVFIPPADAWFTPHQSNRIHPVAPNKFSSQLRQTTSDRIRPHDRVSSRCNARLPSTSLRSHRLAFNPTEALVSLAASSTSKFLSRWQTYCMIPLVAALVGWVTNYLAVKMIFYPIKWRGIRFWSKRASEAEEPTQVGLGWQGIVPANTCRMSISMVNATLTQLIQLEEIVQRLDPEIVADILLPQAPKIMGPMVKDLFFREDGHNLMPGPLRYWALEVSKSRGPLQDKLSRQFLVEVTRDVQRNVDELLNLRNCVVDQTMADRSLLGKLFQIAGRKELAFLTDSGLWFGFLLGLIQLIVALCWDNAWTLSVGGLLVGLATNWLALKWIFEPVNPTPIVGNLVLQGLFLRRQKEVAADFSNFFATKILTSEQLWHSILTDPSTAPIFESIWAQNLQKIALSETKGLVDLGPDNFDPIALELASKRATERLLPLLTDLHPYVDETLDIELTLRTRMRAMTSQQFERVLHPIFEEDELTLIVSGGGLGFAAGLVQQSLASGAIAFLPTWRWLGNTLAASGLGFCAYAIYFASRIRLEIFRRRIFKRLRDPSKIAFDAIDRDGNGFLEPREVSQVARVLGINLSEEELSQAFLELDKNGDGRVSLEEFEDWWNQDLGSVFHQKLAKELGLYERKPRWARMVLAYKR